MNPAARWTGSPPTPACSPVPPRASNDPAAGALPARGGVRDDPVEVAAPPVGPTGARQVVGDPAHPGGRPVRAGPFGSGGVVRSGRACGIGSAPGRARRRVRVRPGRPTNPADRAGSGPAGLARRFGPGRVAGSGVRGQAGRVSRTSARWEEVFVAMNSVMR
ncbi:hypothetical protein Slala03_46690 [Streptomyces lavendulae subsp. lavendulae]|nr:hypothetical protein Slala03_46690 [Streptomyces lavendulae subsp. lavendulae]